MSNTDTYNPDVYRHINKNKEKKEKSKEDEISTVDDEDDDTGSAIEMSMERMIEMAARLNEHMSSLEDRRVFVKQMAAIARDLSEDTFTRVIRWNVLEMIVVIMVAAGQVFYFKSRFNNQKRYFQSNANKKISCVKANILDFDIKSVTSYSPEIMC